LVSPIRKLAIGGEIDATRELFAALHIRRRNQKSLADQSLHFRSRQRLLAWPNAPPLTRMNPRTINEVRCISCSPASSILCQAVPAIARNWKPFSKRWRVERRQPHFLAGLHLVRLELLLLDSFEPEIGQKPVIFQDCPVAFRGAVRHLD